MAKEELKIKKVKPSDLKNFPTLKLRSEREIAMDFSAKLYQKFDRLIKATILFGSIAKHTDITGSDIDIIVIVDDASVRFDEELIVWYREELGKIIEKNPYKKDLHINTIKLTTWWNDLMKGDPTIINILRYGETLVDNGGFFSPIKILLQEGKIKITPEAIYTVLNRIPDHIIRSKISEMSSIEGSFWAITETAQALLMTIKLLPPDPEHIPDMLKENFVDKGLLKGKYVSYVSDIYDLHRKVVHGEIKDINGKIVDDWQNNAEEFFKVAVDLIDKLIK